MIRYSPAVWVSAGRISSGGGSDQTGTIDDSIELFDPLTNQWNIIGDLPQPVRRAASVVLNGKVYVIAGETTGEVNSNKVYAADLPAPAMNLYFKEGNATAEAELVNSWAWRMDRSRSGNWHRMLWPRLDLDHNPATAEGSLLAVPRGTNHPQAMLCTNAPTETVVWYGRRRHR